MHTDHNRQEIAILEPNTLAILGLEMILEEFMPQATVRTFNSFDALIDDTPDAYAHYFVAAQIYFDHTAFFLERKPKAIVLTHGENNLLNNTDIPTLNTNQSKEGLVRDIMLLHQQGHTQRSATPHGQVAQDLSAREIEVLILLTKGYINKEIADRLNISLTTVITHRKNITEKLGIKSVAGLAIYAVINGYIGADSI